MAPRKPLESAPPMRRFLLIVLLAFLPLQSIWAAAAGYCGHEAAPQASHFGHHAHQHQDPGAQPDSGSGLVKALLDLDCHSCHGVCSAMALERSDPPLWLPSQRPSLWVRSVLPVPSPERPERPNWQRLA